MPYFHLSTPNFSAILWLPVLFFMACGDASPELSRAATSSMQPAALTENDTAEAGTPLVVIDTILHQRKLRITNCYTSTTLQLLDPPQSQFKYITGNAAEAGLIDGIVYLDGKDHASTAMAISRKRMYLSIGYAGYPNCNQLLTIDLAGDSLRCIESDYDTRFTLLAGSDVFMPDTLNNYVIALHREYDHEKEDAIFEARVYRITSKRYVETTRFRFDGYFCYETADYDRVIRAYRNWLRKKAP